MTSREQVPCQAADYSKAPQGEHFRSPVAKTLATNDRIITIRRQPRRREVVTG
jgi:hypothetical protein